MAEVGRLKRLDIRAVWQHEAHDFSTWLEQNIEVLSEVVGSELTVDQREKPAGSFKVDLFAQDEAGNRIIIENQLAGTDHDHLGKLITYLTNLDAKKAIWLTSHPRPEHKRAVEWLNEVTPDDLAFYLIRMEAYQIDDSKPAPHFEIEAGPSPVVKERGEIKKFLTNFEEARKTFLDQIAARSDEREDLYYYDLESESKAGLNFYYHIYRDKWTVQLYIEGAEKAKNKEIFDLLYAQREDIENGLGHSLEWYRLDDNKLSRIEYSVETKGLLTDESQWPALQDAIINEYDRFIDAFRPYTLAFTSPVEYKFTERVGELTAQNVDAEKLSDDLANELGIYADPVLMNDGVVAVTIDIHLGDKDKNKRVFDLFYSKREEIEGLIGEKLAWDRVDDRDYSRISYVAAPAIPKDESSWPQVQDKMMKAWIALLNVIESYKTQLMAL